MQDPLISIALLRCWFVNSLQARDVRKQNGVPQGYHDGTIIHLGCVSTVAASYIYGWTDAKLPATHSR